MSILKKIFSSKKASDDDDFLPKSQKNTRISKMNLLGEWGGILSSQNGNEVIYLAGNKEIPCGQWLYFLYHLETLPDKRITFSHAACFWLNVTKPFFIEGHGNMLYPLPRNIDKLFVKDKNYLDWKDSFNAIDSYFKNDQGWKYQWSWKTDGIKNLIGGLCPGWISVK
jgi:hypothetical protein